MESDVHRHLKRLAVAHLRDRGVAAIALEVRCPIARFRLDVAGYDDRRWVPGPNGDARRRSPAPRRAAGPRTIVIECKAERGDFLRERHRLDDLLARRERLERIRRSIEENRIRHEEPNLRRSGSALFAELEEWDFARSRLPVYRRVLKRLARLDAQIHGETKFHLLRRYALADELYITAPRGLIRPAEVPPGWGLLEWPAADGKTISSSRGNGRGGRSRHAAGERALWDHSRAMAASQPRPHACALLHERVGAPSLKAADKWRQRLLRNIAVSASTAAVRGLSSSNGAE